MSKPLAFLTRLKRKTLRTVLYDDSLFHPFEVEILHTPVFQRLYGLKQLGFSDKVFPDAVHSRFNHALGVCDRAEKMLTEVQNWTRYNSKTVFKFAIRDGAGNYTENTISGELLEAHLEKRKRVVRLMGLLHDLTHAAFGHTLEDELLIFSEKHDDPERQARFFDSLTAQLIWIWSSELGFDEVPDPDELQSIERLEIDKTKLQERVLFISGLVKGRERSEMAERLEELELAFVHLLHLDALHSREKALDETNLPVLLITSIISHFEPGHKKPDFEIHRDAIIIDTVGNTICADLIDYGRRDPQFCGLRTIFDDRIMRYLAPISVKGEFSPSGRPCLRLGVQFYTNKIRHDVLSEASKMLKARYLISENVLYHPTKCAAGAMLGAAIQMLGLCTFPAWLQMLTDGELIGELRQTACDLDKFYRTVVREASPETSCENLLLQFSPYDRSRRELIACCVQGIIGKQNATAAEMRGSAELTLRAKTARTLLWKLIARRYPTLVFRLSSGITHSVNADDQTIAATYSKPQERTKLERFVEQQCKLPLGTIFIHCPRYKTSMKIAQALVFGKDPEKVAYLRNVTSVCDHKLNLEPYEKEIQAIEDMYKSIWKFHAYLDPAHLHKTQLVVRVLEHQLRFPNDPMLSEELSEDIDLSNPYDLLGTEYEEKVAFADWPSVLAEMDRRTPLRNRQGSGRTREQASEALDEVIRHVSRSKFGKEVVPEQEELKGIDREAKRTKTKSRETPLPPAKSSDSSSTEN